MNPVLSSLELSSKWYTFTKSSIATGKSRRFAPLTCEHPSLTCEPLRSTLMSTSSCRASPVPLVARKDPYSSVNKIFRMGIIANVGY